MRRLLHLALCLMTDSMWLIQLVLSGREMEWFVVINVNKMHENPLQRRDLLLLCDMYML